MSRISSTKKSTFGSKVSSKLKVTGFSLFPPLSMSEDDAFEAELLPSATENALGELEEKYQDLLDSVDVSKLNPKYLTRYINRAEDRRGGPFKKEEKAHFREMAISTDPEVKRLLALELRVGVPKKVEMEALAAMGNLLLHRDDRSALETFMAKPKKDPNLREWVRTTLMMNRVESWMGKYNDLKEWMNQLVPFQQKADAKGKSPAVKAQGKKSKTKAQPKAKAILGEVADTK